MLRVIGRPLLLVLVTSCGAHGKQPMTAAEHERIARHYEATADSIEDECWKDLRHELTVDPPEWCWKAQDVRFLDANRNAAARHRAAAAAMR